MTIGSKNFEGITVTDLNELIEFGIPEGISIEYKSADYGRNDAANKEFLKDVSSFANTAGGHLIIGMKEEEGVATGFSPLSGMDPDEVLQRMESLIRDGIQPRINGIRIKNVAGPETGLIIVIRVPKSWNPPHRVSVKNSNRFYARTSAGAYEVSVEELRVLFNRAATAHEHVRAFRFERLHKIDAGESPVPLAKGVGRLVLHLVPLSAFENNDQIDLENAFQCRQSLRPIGATAFTPQVNFEGVINFRGGDKCHGYTQLFRNGIIEATRVGIVVERQQQLFIPSLSFEQRIQEAVPMYLDGLKQLDVRPPIVLLVSLQGVRGAILGVEQFSGLDEVTPLNVASLELPEIMFDSYSQKKDYQCATRPIFDALWNAAGYFKSNNFDDDGNWTGARR